MKPRDIAFLLALVTVIGTVKAEPEPFFFIDLWKPLEAIFKLIGKLDFGDLGNIIKIKGDKDDDDKDSKKDIDSKKDNDSKKEYEKESDEKDDDDSDDDWEFDHDFEFLDRNLKNPEAADPVAQSYIARSGGVVPEPNIDKVVSETADTAEVAQEDLEKAVKRSITNYGGGTNKRNVNFELLPKESIRVKRAAGNPGSYEGSGKGFPVFFHKVVNEMMKAFAGFNKLPRKEKRNSQVTNYRTAKRHVEEKPTSGLTLMEKFFWDWLIDSPIDSTIVERDASSLQGLIERFHVPTDRMRRRLKESKIDKRYAK